MAKLSMINNITEENMDWDFKSKNTPFFEGWYFKHNGRTDNISFIIGRSIEASGAGTAFIQVITENASYNINYPLGSFRKFKGRFVIKVGDSYFTEKGIYLNIKSKGLSMNGKIRYSKFTPLKYSFMGPLKNTLNIVSKHEVFSMKHVLSGKLLLNSKILDFDKGTGYIEGDSGRSFPQKYTWVQCNYFDNLDASITTAVAEFRLFGKSFKGTACILNYNGNEYRLATYLGAKVDFCGNNCIIISQRKYKLVIKFDDTKGQKLFAPINGSMTRVIYERICTHGRFWFYEHDNLLTYGSSNRLSYEDVK